MKFSDALSEVLLRIPLIKDLIAFLALYVLVKALLE